MKKATIVLFLLFVSIGVFAQSEWKQVYSSEGITISVKEDDCKNKMGHIEHTYLMKIQNISSTTRSVEWDYELTDTNGNSINCTPGNKENHRMVKIGAFETIEATCDPNARKDLKIAMRFLDLKLTREISKVNLINIFITE